MIDDDDKTGNRDKHPIIKYPLGPEPGQSLYFILFYFIR
jgi:hypothetical protein